MTPPPRAILSLILIVGMMTIVRFGEQMIVKAMSVLVFPFVIALMMLALYLIPQWNGAALETLSLSSASATGNGLLMTLWLAIPVMVFSFNHSPIISSFAVAKREEYGRRREEMLQHPGPRSHHDGADRDVLRLQLRTEPLPGGPGGGERAEHLDSVLPGEPL
jgi:serine transporter